MESGLHRLQSPDRNAKSEHIPHHATVANSGAIIAVPADSGWKVHSDKDRERAVRVNASQLAVARVTGAKLRDRMHVLSMRQAMVIENPTLLTSRALIVMLEDNPRPLGTLSVNVGWPLCWRVRENNNAADELQVCDANCCGTSLYAMNLSELRYWIQRELRPPQPFWFRIPEGISVSGQYYRLCQRDEEFKLAAAFFPVIVLRLRTDGQYGQEQRRTMQENRYEWTTINYFEDCRRHPH